MSCRARQGYGARANIAAGLGKDHVIVVSGALVLVALVLLLIGLANPGLGFLYASIAVSAVAIGALVIGLLQGRAALRKDETTPGSLFGPDPGADDEPDVEPTGERDGAVAPAGATGASVAAATGAGPARPADERPASLPGDERPDVEPLPVPVGGDAEPPVEPAEPLPVDVAQVQAAVGAVVLVVPGRPRYHLAGCRYLAGREAEERSPVDAQERGFTPCGVCRPDARLVAGYEHRLLRAGSGPTSPSAAPGTDASADRPAKRQHDPASYRGPVVVLSDRGRFHRPDCRYVREADGVQGLTRSQALRLDYAPCGVCQP